MKRKYLKEVQNGLAKTSHQTPEVLSESDLENLPELVRKYIRYSGAIGKPKVVSFKVGFTGKIRKNEQSPWMPFRVEQHSFIEESIRLFWMDAVMMHLPVKGFHCFKKGDAFMDIRLFGLFKVQYMDGKEMGISETVTFFNDLCVMAPATLIDSRIKWIKTEGNRVQAEFTDHGITISAWLNFDSEGRLTNFISDDRYEYIGKGKAVQRTWLTPIINYREISEHRMPSEVEVVYKHPKGDFCYGIFEMTDMQYNFSAIG